MNLERVIVWKVSGFLEKAEHLKINCIKREKKVFEIDNFKEFWQK